MTGYSEKPADHKGKPGGLRAPSAWVERFAGLVPASGEVLDVACGAGRHLRYFLARGHRVAGVDADVSRLADLRGRDGVEIVEADLEDGARWPFEGRAFAAIIVTNYLHRPLFPALVAGLAAGGVLIYETFAQGNQQYGKPRNPDHLLRPGELLQAVEGRLQVVAYEFGQVARPRPAVIGRLCALSPAPDALPRLESDAPATD